MTFAFIARARCARSWRGSRTSNAYREGRSCCGGDDPRRVLQPTGASAARSFGRAREALQAAARRGRRHPHPQAEAAEPERVPRWRAPKRIPAAARRAVPAMAEPGEASIVAARPDLEGKLDRTRRLMEAAI